MHQIRLKSVIIADDGLGGQVEAEIGGIVFSKLPLILQLIPRNLLHLHILQVLLPFPVPLRIVRVVVLGITLVAVVHRQRSVLLLLLQLLICTRLLLLQLRFRLIVLLGRVILFPPFIVLLGHSFGLFIAVIPLPWVVLILVFGFQMGVVGFGEERDIFLAIVIAIHIIGLIGFWVGVLLRAVGLVILGGATTGEGSLVLAGPPFLESVELFLGDLPALLVVGLFLVLAHVEGLVVAAGEFLLRLELVLDRLVHPGAARRALDVDGVEVAAVGLVERDAVLEGVAFGRLEDALGGDFGVVEVAGEVLAAAVGEVVLPRGDLGREVLGLAVEPGAVGEVVLLVEGTGLVVGELVISHIKFIADDNYNQFIQQTHGQPHLWEGRHQPRRPRPQQVQAQLLLPARRPPARPLPQPQALQHHRPPQQQNAGRSQTRRDQARNQRPPDGPRVLLGEHALPEEPREAVLQTHRLHPLAQDGLGAVAGQAHRLAQRTPLQVQDVPGDAVHDHLADRPVPGGEGSAAGRTAAGGRRCPLHRRQVRGDLPGPAGQAAGRLLRQPIHRRPDHREISRHHQGAQLRADHKLVLQVLRAALQGDRAGGQEPAPRPVRARARPPAAQVPQLRAQPHGFGRDLPHQEDQEERVLLERADDVDGGLQGTGAEGLRQGPLQPARIFGRAREQQVHQEEVLPPRLPRGHPHQARAQGEEMIQLIFTYLPFLILQQCQKQSGMVKTPTSRNRTSDLRITAQLYSPPLYQLSYGRLQSFDQHSQQILQRYFLAVILTYKGIKIKTNNKMDNNIHRVQYQGQFRQFYVFGASKDVSDQIEKMMRHSTVKRIAK